MKNLVICCDGTSNEFGRDFTNVATLFRALEYDSPGQLCFYDPGVGTIGSPYALSSIGQKATKFLGLAFGYGITDNIAEAYRFLMDSFEPGDRVFLFGFSRGAYTVRAIAGMLHSCGLLRKGTDNLVAYGLRLARDTSTRAFELRAAFKKTFSRPCPVHFMGIWDTVSSVGWVYSPKPFINVTTNPEVRHVRHAVAIDERRAFFRQHLWHQSGPEQELKQVWFAGVHCDVGGGYPESESRFSSVPLDWIASEAVAEGLRLAAATPGNRSPSPQLQQAEIHRSLKGLWWVAELWPKIVWHPIEAKHEVRFNLGRHRVMADRSVIHASVAELIEDGYAPKNLPKDVRVMCRCGDEFPGLSEYRSRGCP